MSWKRMTTAFLGLAVTLSLVGCEQPEMFKTKAETNTVKANIENVTVTSSKTIEEEFRDSFKEEAMSKEYELLSKETDLNTLNDSQMVELGRELMKKEVQIYSLKDNKSSFDKWVKEVYLHPSDNEFLRYYDELGAFKEVKISFDQKDNNGNKIERVQRFGKTGFLYHSIMNLTGINKKNGNEEMAILNLIVHIDKDQTDGKYKIVKMGGPVANAVTKAKE